MPPQQLCSTAHRRPATPAPNLSLTCTAAKVNRLISPPAAFPSGLPPPNPSLGTCIFAAGAATLAQRRRFAALLCCRPRGWRWTSASSAALRGVTHRACATCWCGRCVAQADHRLKCCWRGCTQATAVCRRTAPSHGCAKAPCLPTWGGSGAFMMCLANRTTPPCTVGHQGNTECLQRRSVVAGNPGRRACSGMFSGSVAVS